MANVVEVIFRGVDQISRDTAQINRSMQAMNAIALRLAGTLAAAFSVRELVRAADTMRLVENRLRLVTDSTQELNAVQDSLLALANETRTSFESTVELYARVARSADQLGLSHERLLNLTRTINQAIQASGATAQEAAAGLVQFSQGLASGALRGDELRSVLEQMPRLARAIADGMGVTIGQLRELGAAGRLSAEQVIEALESQADAIQREYDQVETTIGGAITNLKNSFLGLVDTVDEATGSSSALAGTIQSFANLLQGLSGVETLENLRAELAELEAELTRERSVLEEVFFGQDEHFRVRVRKRIEEIKRLIGELTESNVAALDPLMVEVPQLETVRVTAREMGRFADLSAFDEANAALARLTAQFEDFSSRVPARISNVQVELGEMSDTLQTIDVKRVGDGVIVTFEKAKDSADELTVAAEEAARRIQNAFAEFLFDPFDEGLKGMLKGFIDIVRQMIAEALAARLVDKLFGKKGESGSREGGILGDIIGILVGGGKATGGFTTPGMAHPINEREPEFLITPQRSEVIPLSKAAAQGLVGRGAPVTFNTTNNITTSVSPLELEAALARHDDMLLARFKQWQLDGGMT
ncbi:MAG TPA: tape measure protein [Steroidobacteraceae bacterium]